MKHRAWSEQLFINVLSDSNYYSALHFLNLYRIQNKEMATNSM
jgi:hypothetical protein